LFTQVYLLFEHAVTHFDPDFILKTDDDTFVNIPVVLHMLQQLGTERSMYIGERVNR
jgi:hypothetical protein